VTLDSPFYGFTTSLSGAGRLEKVGHMPLGVLTFIAGPPSSKLQNH
jgi:hypothetical protein